MCIACRASADRSEMLRFVRAPDGAVAFDARARVDGRGAWTCPTAACVRAACAKDAFQRAFDAPVLVSADALAAEVQRILTLDVLGGFGVLRKVGAVFAGREEVARELAAGRVLRLALACDLSERSRDDLIRQTHGEPVALAPPMAELGHAIGRKPTGVLAVRSGPRADALFADLRRWAAFVGLEQPASTHPVVASQGA